MREQQLFEKRTRVPLWFVLRLRFPPRKTPVDAAIADSPCGTHLAQWMFFRHRRQGVEIVMLRGFIRWLQKDRWLLLAGIAGAHRKNSAPILSLSRLRRPESSMGSCALGRIQTRRCFAWGASIGSRR
jgi:hypothetical protein